MNILILGGGPAGLALAGLIDNSRHRVVIIEQDSPEDFAKKWHWYDNLDVAALRRLGYGDMLPDSFPAQGDRLVGSPSGKFKLRFKMKSALIYEQVYRPSLLRHLQEKARGNASLRYDTRAEALLIEDGRVKGASLSDGHDIYADLTVDCTGVSELSRPLLEEYYRREKDTMTVFRAVLPREQKDTPPAVDIITLRPEGSAGFSRYSLDASGKTDIKLSHMGPAEKGWAAKLLPALISEHSAWDMPDVRGGEWGEYLTPARCPLTQLVFDGCALLGDSACMATPYTCLGIVNAMRGAKILSEIVNGCDGTSTGELWAYQTRYYKAAKDVWRHFILSRWLQESPDDILERLFSSRIFTPEDARRVFTGRFLSLAPRKLFRRSVQLLLHPKLLFSITGMFVQAFWAEECGRSIPEKYDEKRVAAWRSKLEKALE